METQTTANRNLEIASTILHQLGGRRFIAMTGASCYYDGAKAIFKFKGSRVANCVSITLNVMDTYDVVFTKFRGIEVKTVREINGVYAEDLADTFESVTGLRTRL